MRKVLPGWLVKDGRGVSSGSLLFKDTGTQLGHSEQDCCDLVRSETLVFYVCGLSTKACHRHLI